MPSFQPTEHFQPKADAPAAPLDLNAPDPYAPAQGTVIELNSADAEAIASLPGIGHALAALAVQVRDEQQGFNSLDDFCGLLGITDLIRSHFAPYATVTPPPGRVVDVPAAPDITVTAGVPTLELVTRPVTDATTVASEALDFSALQPPAAAASGDRLVDVNRANALELVQLPGFTPDLAQYVIQQRIQRGGFQSCRDVLQLLNLSDADAMALLPHLTISPWRQKPEGHDGQSAVTIDTPASPTPDPASMSRVIDN